MTKDIAKDKPDNAVRQGMPFRSLGTLFEPRTIAVIGASHGMDRIGGRPIQHTQQAGFAGKIYPVNPSYDQVADLPCYADIASVPDQVDLAIIAVRAQHVTTILTECAQANIPSAIVFSAGFAELGSEGHRLQEQIGEIAQQSGMNVLGPNCLGALSYRSKLMATFTRLDVAALNEGPIGFVSQSGLAGTYFLSLARKRGMGFSKWVATGNEADLTATDCIAYLAEDDQTEIILAFIEGVRDGDGFCQALDLAWRKEKPVVLFKVGSSQAGARAAISHTASMVGDDVVFDAVCRRYGAHRVHDFHEMLSFAETYSKSAIPSGRRLCILTLSGGVGILMADSAEKCGLQLPEMPEPAQALLRERVAYAPVANPVDLTGHIIHDPSIIELFLKTIIDTGSYDAVAVFLGQVAEDPQVMKHYISTARRSTIPVLLSGVTTSQIAEQLDREGLLQFEDPNDLVMAINALSRSNAVRGLRKEDAPPVSENATFQAAVTRQLQSRKMDLGSTEVLGEGDSRELLAAGGIPMIRGERARSEEEALELAAKIGYPVVLKVDSADIGHKSDIGGVVTGIANEHALRLAYASISSKVGELRPDARVESLLVQEMAQHGFEVILGVKRDPSFGATIMIGAGGIHAEILDDAEFDLCPLSIAGAKQLIVRTRMHRLLTAARGQGPYDVEALAEALSILSYLASSEPRLLEVDINPLLVRPTGEGVMALDALVVLGALPEKNTMKAARP